MTRNKRITKVIAIVLLISFLNSIIYPVSLFALTSGPASPEFSSYEPVATTDMVDIFSGDFTYNLPVVSIPGPDGGGYALSLSYHSGVGPEEEASWVGLGWTLNPGAINRNKIGLPDDYKGLVIKYNKTRPNWSVSAKASVDLEILSKNTNKDNSKAARANSDLKHNSIADWNEGKNAFSVGVSKSIRFNNYRGYMKSFGFSSAVKGIGSMSLERSGSKYKISVNPEIVSSLIKKKLGDKSWITKILDRKLWDQSKAKTNMRRILAENGNRSLSASMNQVSNYAVRLLEGFSSPVSSDPYTGFAFNNELGFNIFGYLPIGIELGYHTSFNLQMNMAQNVLMGFGYMYNPSKGDAMHAMSDYYVEKAIAYDKKDKYLGIPHNGADNYIVSGEQISGGFRMFPKTIGTYFPATTYSSQPISQLGFELGVGPGIVNVGLNVGGGFQKTTTGDWGAAKEYSSSTGSIFRFTNDLGGDISYLSSSAGSAPLSAAISWKTPFTGPDFTNFGRVKDSLGLVNRSSFIEHNLNKTLSENPGLKFEKSRAIQDLLKDVKITGVDDGIAEYAITNETGIKYVYGLPVYSMNNKSLTTNVSPRNDKIENRFLAYKNLYVKNKILDNTVLLGESTISPYAVNYLLTQIVTPDYVDIDENGPDDQDFGGWTRFDYRRWKSENDSTRYHYRAPYNGLTYDENQVSTSYDDMANMSSGDKQVYYIKAIETKSHVAFFITNRSKASDFVSYTTNEIASLNGSGDKRHDQLGASREGVDTDPAAFRKDLKDTTQRLEKLERIVLYAKGNFEKPISTVYFDYDYSLCKNLPNSDGGAKNNGKLTLKKVWFESEGAVNSRIAPYQFVYEYAKVYPKEIQKKYPDLSNYANKLDYGSQNPDYEPYALDMWGNYQYDGAKRRNERIPWVYQGNEKHDQFDPAAWNLKKIILPSGGEIHIQYEQKDYAYVQDKEAMAMCSLLSGNAESYSPEDSKYFINTEDLGIPENALNDYLLKLKHYFLPSDSFPNPNLIYFKYLYSLPGDKPAQFDKCWMEYLSAYTNVNDIGIENGKIYFKLGAARKWVSWFGNKLKNPNTTNVPRTVCYDYVVNNADGLLEGDQCDCDLPKFNYLESQIGSYYDKIIHNDNVTRAEWRVMVSTPASVLITSKIFKPNVDKNSICKYIDYKHSFLRLPVYKSKKGGGIRVKRLLMYDKGMENGDAMVYGNEYLYETENGLSSGVATNEPMEGREENALVQLLDEKSLSWLGNIMYGEDLKQSEGPLGENLLPGASIGYSRVVIKNIHEGKTGTGYTVHTFHTVREYPMKVSFTDLDIDHKLNIPIMIPAGLFYFSTDRMYLTQGYKFTISEFHGRPEMVANYRGDYKTGKIQMPVSYTKYRYFDLEKEDVPYLIYKPEKKAFDITYGKPGKEEDITSESRSVYDQTVDFNLELDLSFSLPVVVTFSFAPSFTYDEKLINTHVTSTVVRYPAIVKATESYSDAGTVTTEYLAFNPQNGAPVVTRTNDGYDNVRLQYMNADNKHNGGYYSWDFPAAWIYPELGPKSSSDTARRTNQLKLSAGSMVTYGEEGNWLKDAGNQITANRLSGVVSASFTIFKNGWFQNTEDLLKSYKVDSKYLNRLNQNWYPNSFYVFNSNNIKQANDPDSGRIYNGGIIRDFEMFDWNHTKDLSSKWIKSSEITAYSPNGSALEEKDVLGIYSAARFGYHNQLPVVTAKNAQYSSVFFDDFENNPMAEKTASHCGYQSLNLKLHDNYNFISDQTDGIRLTEQLKSKGATIKLWMNSTKKGDALFLNSSSEFSALLNGIAFPFRKIAMVGDWGLYEAVVSNWPSTFKIGEPVSVKLKYTFLPGEEVFIDDFRMQPLDSEVSCVVYDVKTYKVLAQFDNQHFGLFYQYNREGQLVRKIVETERGVKTIQENQYNIPKQPRLTTKL